jgi:transketolase
MLATASNFETRTNGATHMGNDDIIVFDAIGQVKIIDVSCPQQMLSVMKWIMEGNKGLVYVRVMRTPSAVLYDGNYAFEFGKGHILKQTPADVAVVISSGRGVHEALAAAKGTPLTVVDMPSIDDALLLQLYDSGKPLLFAEQNNGFIWQNFLKALYRNGRKDVDFSRVFTINTLDAEGRPRFIHSGTYEELIQAFGLTPQQIAETVGKRIGK